MTILNKNYTKMQGSDLPSTIDNTNQTQMSEVEADMFIIETDLTQIQDDAVAHESNTSNPHEVTSAQAGAIADGADTVKKSHIDFGTGANQVNSDDIPEGSTHNFMTDAERSKLSGIEDGATADQTGAEIKTLYEGESNTNAFTDSEKAKLASIDATHYLPPLADLTALAAITGMTDKARCYVETEITDYFYDKQAISGDVAAPPADGGYWKKVVSSGETAASIKTKYESNADTNAFTDTEKSKLGAIESGADVTDAGNVGTAIHGATAKTTPVDDDEFGIIDSAASNVLKKLTWANLKSAIATYYNSLTATLTNKTLTSPTVNTPELTLANTTPTTDGSIGFDRTNEDLVIGDGTNGQIVHIGAFKSFASNFTNLSVGSGSLSGKFTQIGKKVFGRIDLTFAANTTVSGSITFTLPVPSVSLPGTAQTQAIGQAFYFDQNTSNTYGGYCRWATTTTATLVINNASGTYTILNGVNQTVPFTWTTSDELHIEFTYEAA